MSRSLVIGSRGSKLALWQAEHVQSQLQTIDPNLTVRIEIIKKDERERELTELIRESLETPRAVAAA